MLDQRNKPKKHDIVTSKNYSIEIELMKKKGKNESLL